MLHWTPGRFAALPVTPVGRLADDRPSRCAGSARSDHARMMSHAARRRRAAGGEDGAYWKACAPSAVARAAAIRSSAGFARLP